MDTEFEAKILEIDVDEIQKKLAAIGAKRLSEKFQRRYVYAFVPDQEEKWVRLRTDGNTTTLTIKEVVDHSITGTKEMEVEVSNFELTHQMLLEFGLKQVAYQENKRISYSHNGVDLEIDTWPQIPTYLEIEGPDEKSVVQTIEDLGFDPEDAVSKPVKLIYKDYGIDLHEIDELKF